MSPPRFTLRWLIVAVAILAFLFAALRYDIGEEGYALFLASCLVFAASAAVAVRKTGAARVAALAVATLGCGAGLAAFAIFGRP